jgi:hypothetical protein
MSNINLIYYRPGLYIKETSCIRLAKNSLRSKERKGEREIKSCCDGCLCIVTRATRRGAKALGQVLKSGLNLLQDGPLCYIR